MKVTFRAEAREDMYAAAKWYEENKEGLGACLLEAIAATLRDIVRFPESFVRVDGGIRRALVRKFPYSIFYIIDGDIAVVVSILHNADDPNKWPTHEVE